MHQSYWLLRIIRKLLMGNLLTGQDRKFHRLTKYFCSTELFLIEWEDQQCLTGAHYEMFPFWSLPAKSLPNDKLVASTTFTGRTDRYYWPRTHFLPSRGHGVSSSWNLLNISPVVTGSSQKYFKTKIFSHDQLAGRWQDWPSQVSGHNWVSLSSYDACDACACTVPRTVAVQSLYSRVVTTISLTTHNFLWIATTFL